MEVFVEVEIEEDEEWMAHAPEAVNVTEMVEGWLEGSGDTPPPLAEEADFCSHMQVAAKVRATTAFASYLARLQAHFESMTKQQSANIIHFLHKKLEEWRGKWIMALTSVSRDRADRLWALLITYQGDPDCITEKDRSGAESRWKEVVEMLQIDAVKEANVEDFRLPNQSRVVRIEDTQHERASSSGDVLVQRRPGETWTDATEEERDELRRHDETVKEEETRQAEHDEWLWQSHKAAEARSWDEWAMKTELEGPARTPRERPLKRFRVKVSVIDSEHNELAVADLKGEVDVNDVPQVNVIVQERVVQIPVQEEMEQEQQELDDSHREKEANSDKTKGEGKHELDINEGTHADDNEEDKAETLAVPSPEGDIDEGVDAEMTDLEAILETVMGRQWFQLFVQRQVDEEMVKKRWGAMVLEVFQVNRDMMDMAEEQEQHGVGPRAMEMRMGEGDVNVRPMWDNSSSTASSGAKVFPKITVVAGRRGTEESVEADSHLEVNTATSEEQVMPNRGDVAVLGGGGSGDDVAASEVADSGQQSGETQQVLQDTQLELMDVESEEAAAASTRGTTNSTEGGEDSFGAGKVQTNLQGWLK